MSKILVYVFDTGAFAALCVLTKYQAALLLFPMLMLCVLNPLARNSFKKSGIYCALLVFIGLLLPHCFWLINHHFVTLNYAAEITSDYTSHKSLLSYLTHPAGFIVNSVIDVTGLILLLWPFYTKKKDPMTITTFQWQFILILGLGPCVISLLLCMFTGDYFPPRWSTPYFFMMGILAMAILKPALNQRKINSFAISLVCFSMLLFIIKAGSGGMVTRVSSDAFLPDQKIAHALTAEWKKHSQAPLMYLAGSHYLVTSVIPYMKHKPVPYLSWDLVDSSWIDEQKLRSYGALFIWDKGGNYTWDKISLKYTLLAPDIKARFPHLHLLPDLTFYRISSHLPVCIGMAILLPEDTSL